MSEVAALYVLERSSPYRLIDGVDLWPPSRDARAYPGDWPVVTHADCGPYSLKWHRSCKKGPEAAALAPLAVEQVRTWGGIFEHPAESLLWSSGGGSYDSPKSPHSSRLPLPVSWKLLRPPKDDQLLLPLDLSPPPTPRDAFGGFTIEVELCWWKSGKDPVYWRKPTWLYFCGLGFDEVVAALPDPCDPDEPPRDTGFRTDFPTQRRSYFDIASREERQRTPLGMARWLVDLAARAKPPEGP